MYCFVCLFDFFVDKMMTDSEISSVVSVCMFFEQVIYSVLIADRTRINVHPLLLKLLLEQSIIFPHLHRNCTKLFSCTDLNSIIVGQIKPLLCPFFRWFNSFEKRNCRENCEGDR